MSRSIHTTRHNIEEMKCWNFSDSERRKRLIVELEEQAAIKRRTKRRVKEDRSCFEMPLQPVDVEQIPIVVNDTGKYIHYPASPDDIRSVMRLLPIGVMDGASRIELCLGADYQNIESSLYNDNEDPYTGRIGCEVLPDVYCGRCQAIYTTGESRIRLFAYVYDLDMPDRSMWECCLRLEMLSSFVHEVAHHYDFMMRVARGRWRMDDHDKAEIYAESIQHDWVEDYIVSYIKQAYSEQVKNLDDWIQYYGGASVSLLQIAGDPRTTAKNGLINISKAWFSISSAIGNLAKSVANGESLPQTRLGFARDLHYSELYELALQIIDDVLAENPDDLEALTLKADIYEHQEQHQEARVLAESAVQKDDSCEDAWRVLVNVYEEINNWQGLQDATTILIDKAKLGAIPKSSMLLSRARAKFELGDSAGALADLDVIDAIQWNSPRGTPTWIIRRIAELRGKY